LWDRSSFFRAYFVYSFIITFNKWGVHLVGSALTRIPMSLRLTFSLLSCSSSSSLLCPEKPTLLRWLRSAWLRPLKRPEGSFLVLTYVFPKFQVAEYQVTEIHFRI
jgi:hypothetical protein